MSVKLYGVCALNSIRPYATLRQQNSSSGYKVPFGMTLVIKYFLMNVNRRRNPISIPTNHTIMGASFGYGDNDVGFASGTTPTNATYIGNFVNDWIVADGLGLYAEALVDFQVPSQKYPFAFKSMVRDNVECAFIAGGDLQ